MRSLVTSASMTSCAASSVRVPAARSRSAYTSKKPDSRPMLMAAPSWLLTDPRYAK